MEKFIRTVLRGLGCSNALRLPDGKKVTSDKPTAEEAGSFAVWAAENVKEGDKVLLIGRLAGSKDGKVSLYTKGRDVRTSYLDVSINSLSITDKKVNRMVKPVPTEADTPLKATATPVASIPVRQSVPSTVSRPALPVRPSIPVKPVNDASNTANTNPFAKFKKS